MTTRGLILDFGGVVTSDFYGAMRAFCEREGLPSNAVEAILRNDPEGSEALAAVESGSISQREYEIILGDRLGVSDAGLLQPILADLAPCQPVVQLVKHARSKGVRTAVLSNSWGTGQYDPYLGYDLEANFDAVLISDQIGLRKPDPAVYRLAAQTLDLGADACVFVDDTPRNLPPAQALGMQTVLFRHANTGVAEIVAKLGLNLD